MTTTADLAAQLIQDARNYATDNLAAASTEMGFAMTVLSNLQNSPAIKLTLPAAGPPVPGDPGAVPAYTGPHFVATKFNGVEPKLQDISPLVLPGNPTAPDQLSYDAPSTPSGEPSTAGLGDIPTLDDLPAMPVAPDLLSEIRGIQAPPLLSITIPDAPNFVPPEFLGVRPNAAVAPPTGLDATMRDQFAAISPIMRDAVSTQLDAFLDREFPQFRSGMAAIETRLATYLAGGTALTPAIENAIYNRTLDKTSADSRRAARTLWESAAQRGHTIPSAILLAQQQDAAQESRNANVRAAIEIAVKQAELEQNNLQFAVTQSASLRNVAISAAMSYYSGMVQINGQALEYARDVLDAIVKAYDISARYAEIQARLYEADATIYRAQLEGALAVIEAYKAKIQGLEAQAQVNVAQVEAYRERIGAVEAEATVYRSEIEAIVAQAQLQRIKVELYDSKVRAYGAQVNAYSARWQGYAAAVSGQAAKMQVNAERVRAFQAEWGAYDSQVRAKATEIESQTRVNEQLLKVYQVDVEAFAALNRAEAEAVAAEVGSFSATIDAFKAKANAVAEKSRANIASYEVALRGLVAQADLYLSELREQNKVNVSRAEGIARVGVAAGEVYAGIAQSSLSGMNSLASINLSAQE